MASLDPMLSQLTQIVLLAVVTAVGGVVTNAVHKASAWFQRKTGLDVDKQATGIAQESINYAEEKAHQFLREHGRKLEAKAKESIARSYALGKAQKAKLPKPVQDGINEIIEAALGAARSGAPR